MKLQRNKFSLALIAFVLSVVLGGAIPAFAGDNLQSGACVEFADTLNPEFWVPMGCELVDCCVGCPGNVIDWRIRVSGAALERVVLQFDNLPPEVLRRLKIKGRGRWVGTSLILQKGETILSGFEYDKRSTPPIAAPSLIANKEVLRKLKAAADRGDAAVNDDGRMELVIEQMMGKYVVNEARIGYNLTTCPNFPGNTDHIAVSNNIGDDTVIGLIDARDGNGCFSDTHFKGKDNIFLGNLPSTGGCNSEFAIFSKDNAMMFRTPVFWTDSVFDKEPVTLQPMLEAPVAVWIVIDESGAQERAEWDFANANFLFNSNYAGISFNPTFKNISLIDGVRETIGCGECARKRIMESPYYKPDQLNVYYIDMWGFCTEYVKARNCWRKIPDTETEVPTNIIFVNRWAPNDSLTHEIGHAFSLDDIHTCVAKPLLGAWGTNHIMCGGKTGRTDFTEGQTFRMNVNVTSMINVNGVRTGRMRDPACTDTTTNEFCPKLIETVMDK